MILMVYQIPFGDTRTERPLSSAVQDQPYFVKFSNEIKYHASGQRTKN